MSVHATIVRLVVRYLASLLPRFSASDAGNVAVIFAIACIPLIAAMGLAVDYTRAAQTSTEMQDALDAASLALSRQTNLSTMTSAQIQTFAENYFNANFSNSELQNLTLKASYTVTGPSVTISASARLPTDFMGIIGTKDVPIGRSSTTVWGEARLRVALVLDNTGSMLDSGKLTALKTATKNLLGQLQAAAGKPGDVYVSIVPFVKDVHVVNAASYTSSWDNWIDWSTTEPANATPAANIGPGSACPYSTGWGGIGFNCVTQPAGSTSTNTIPSSGTYKGYICPGKNGDGTYNIGCYTSTTYYSSGSSATCSGHSNCSCSGKNSRKVCQTNSGYYEHAWVVPDSAKTKWTGCVTDRGDSSAPSTGNYDTNVTDPTTTITATLFPAEQYAACPSTVSTLSYDWSAMTTMVTNMSANGSTNQGIGLVHGWQSLVGGGPYPTPPAKDPAYHYKTIIILLTDGLNTQDRWYGNGTPYQSASVIDQIDNRMYYKSGSTITGTCQNIKDNDITIYTVQVNTGGDPTSTLLQNCASSSDKFFLLTTADQIVTTFQQIGTELSELRISQ